MAGLITDLPVVRRRGSLSCEEAEALWCKRARQAKASDMSEMLHAGTYCPLKESSGRKEPTGENTEPQLGWRWKGLISSSY